MSFSIITVNYNNESGLDKTISNIVKLKEVTKEDVELIVIDGCSNDKSLNVINNNKHHIDKWIYETDDGIFDAMNKGIDLATNDWLIFMNSGDIFYDSKILNKIPSKILCGTINLIYGNKVENGVVCKAKSIHSLKLGVIHACHQSMLFKRRLDIKYDVGIVLYGDFGFVADYYLASPEDIFYLDEIISETEPNGIGSKANFTKRKEKYQLVYSRFGLKAMLLAALYKLKTLVIGK